MSGRLQCNTILITASRLFSLQSTETDGEHLHMVQRHSCKSSISAKTNKIPSRPSCSDQFILESRLTLASNFKISPRGAGVQDNGTDSTLMWPLTTKFYSVHSKIPWRRPEILRSPDWYGWTTQHHNASGRGWRWRRGIPTQESTHRHNSVMVKNSTGYIFKIRLFDG